MAKRTYTWTTAALVAGTLVSGCADEQEPLIVLRALAMSDGECVADPGAAGLARGRLDVSFGSPYLLAVALQNQLLPQTNTNSGVDDGELQLRDVDVKLTSDHEFIDAIKASDASLVDFTATLASDSLPPDSQVGVFVEAIPGQTSEAIAQELALYEPFVAPEVIVHLVFHARRTGNAVGGVGDIEAREYTFPINVCLGCMIQCYTCAGGMCPGLDQVDSFTGGVCGNMQDIDWVPGSCAPAEEEM